MKNKHFDKRYIPAKYIQRYFSWNCSAEMQEMKLFPNLKEIAESLSMFYAVEEKLMIWDQNINKNDPTINIVVVGDGVRPRTGCVFAFNTKWKVWSIDPGFRNENYSRVKNLIVTKSKVEDIPTVVYEGITIIILPHSHAPIQECWNKIICDRKWLIKLECCTHDRLPGPYYCYKDMYAITQANNIFIWNNYLNLKYERDKLQ